MNVHLVDGTYELFRAFYAVPSAKNLAGLEVGAVRGLARSMLSLLREPGASHVAIAFDHVIESFRNELFDGYKTGEGDRSGPVGPVRTRGTSLLSAWHRGLVDGRVRSGRRSGDRCACALRGAPEVERVLIASPDKDLAQCVVGTRVVCPRSHAQEAARRSRRSAQNSASARRKSPTTSRWLATRRMASPECPAGARNRRRPSCANMAPSTPSQIRPHPGAFLVRGAAALAESLAARRADALLYKRLATLRVGRALDREFGRLALSRRCAGATRGAGERAVRHDAARACSAIRLSDARLRHYHEVRRWSLVCHVHAARRRYAGARRGRARRVQPASGWAQTSGGPSRAIRTPPTRAR